MRVLKNENNKNEIKKGEQNNSKELTVKKSKPEKKKSKKSIKGWLVSGVVTILLVLIIIDVYLLANMLLDKVTLPEFDLTENKVYSLSDETKDKLKNLENEVKITFINYEDADNVVNFAEKYIILNDKIKIEKINDLASRKDLMEEYSLDTTSQLIIVNSGENETTLGEYDLYTYDYSTYETIDTTEEAITNAIVEVTTKDKPKVYFMSNHAEYAVESYFNTIMNQMREEANDVDTVDILLSGNVPEDCNTLVITTLAEDITTFEKDKILEYINRGGEILLLHGPDIKGKNLANFQEILNQYGITIENGVIFEGNSSNMLYGYPDFIVQKIQRSSLTEKLNMNLSICFADAASIKFDEGKQEELNVEYEKLVYTSNEAFRRTDLTINTASRTDLDSEQEELVVGAIANKKIDENKNSKLIFFGNELFASDMQVTLNGYDYYIVELYNNADVILNSIAYLNEREDTITIRKSYDTVTYTATELQHNIIMAIIFILPLIIIIIGIVVWQVRRRKK